MALSSLGLYKRLVDIYTRSLVVSQDAISN
jgi:hypothetical protein